MFLGILVERSPRFPSHVIIHEMMLVILDCGDTSWGSNTGSEFNVSLICLDDIYDSLLLDTKCFDKDASISR